LKKYKKKEGPHRCTTAIAIAIAAAPPAATTTAIIKLAEENIFVIITGHGKRKNLISNHMPL
jgi:hypothetical protein